MLKPEPVEPQAVAPVVHAEDPQTAAQEGALARFREHLVATPPRAALTLAAVLIAVFCLQLFVGNGDSTGTVELVQLGALVPARVLAGEWWRVIGWSFLHIGGLHIFMNTYALYVIGSPLERVVGTWRFLTIHTSAVLLGAGVVMLTSAAQLTAGASGGIFGLLGAEAVLVLSPRSPLPATLRVQRRNAVLMNLAINVFYSFRPNVSFAGHAGGFIAGALVALFIPSTLEGLIDGAKRPLPRALGIVSALLLVVGLVASIGPTLPALLSPEPVTLTPQALPGMGLHASLPTELGVPEALDANTVRVGTLATDRAVVALVRIPNESPMSASEMDAELTALLAQFEVEETRTALIPEGTVFQDAAMTELAGRPTLRVHFQTPNAELVQTTLFRPQGDAFMRIDLVYWSRFAHAYGDCAERIAASIE